MEILKCSEFQEISSIDDVERYRTIILGQMFGLALSPRGAPLDMHVCFTILSEDDGHWFQSTSSSSSYWLSDLADVSKRAAAWCAQHCDPAVDDQGRQWGWKFR